MIVPCLQGASRSVLKGGIPLKRYFLTNLKQVSSLDNLDLKVVGRNFVLSSTKTINQTFKVNTQISLKRFRLSLAAVKKKGKIPHLVS